MCAEIATKADYFNIQPYCTQAGKRREIYFQLVPDIFMARVNVAGGRVELSPYFSKPLKDVCVCICAWRASLHAYV